MQVRRAASYDGGGESIEVSPTWGQQLPRGSRTCSREHEQSRPPSCYFRPSDTLSGGPIGPHGYPSAVQSSSGGGKGPAEKRVKPDAGPRAPLTWLDGGARVFDKELGRPRRGSAAAGD